MTENNSTWGSAFYQSEWVIINSSWIILVYFMCVAANASKLFCMAHLANIKLFLCHSNLSYQISNFIYMHVNSTAWADENQLKCEKVSFLSEISEINSRWVIFNH